MKFLIGLDFIIFLKNSMKKLVGISFLLSLFIFILDRLTKAFIVSFIPLNSPAIPWYPYGGIGIFENLGGIEFSIIRLANKGAAWGMFTEWHEILLILRLILIGGMILYLFFFNNNMYTVIPLSLIITGAFGNVLDSFIYGHVVDMIHFVFWGHSFPAFNIADAAICIGVGSLFLTSYFPSSIESPV